ncbi:MAG: BTAD domain-containing putative transcriptional regulator, partial [Candidatus Sericytochromatia bacterium]
VTTWINRLRTALETEAGKHAILFSDGLYRFNPAINIEVDTRECEFAMQQAETAVKGSMQRIRHWEKALGHVSGEFLSEFPSLYWVQLEQERYKRLIRMATEEILEYYFQLQQFNQVLKWSEWTLKADPCCEAAHLYCLRAFEALGNRRGVVKHHERMAVIFARELGSGPPEEASLILNRVTRKA